MFESLERKPPDAILKLIAEYGKDTRKEKIDLGVGIYRDADGNTPVLRAVKTAERRLLDTQTSKSYLGVRGAADFCAAQQAIVLGEEHRENERVMTLQTPGGSGALRVAAGVILRANPDTTLWFSEPTWNNHVPLLGGAGLKLESYPYYDATNNVLQFDAMRRTLQRIPAGDVVLLHGCCHNPTGMDLSPGQWDEVADLVADRGLLPFVDIAYQGFAEGLEKDAYGLRRIFDRVPEMLIAASCSKNFGLYRDRVGSLTFLSSSAEASDTVSSQALNIVRTMYSLPPDHGAAAVTLILNDQQLRADWLAELDAMRARIKEMRKLLVAALAKSAPDHDFSHIEKGNGLFCYLGVSPEQVAVLKRDFGVYLVDTGRINVCGINSDNVDYLADSVAAVL
ncbi:MAG: amino acid aminotransferase [Woeseiaceae bacterium]|nr:amino acid aminotransferase [Woeseiaceae bacterium]